MKVTPLDLRKQTFRQAMRGFDKTEVTAFLSEVADEYELALRESDRLHDCDQVVQFIRCQLGKQRHLLQEGDGDCGAFPPAAAARTVAV